MPEFFKCTRPDGKDFYTHSIDYGAALVSGEVIRHPAARMVPDEAATYLSISTSPSDCTGFRWTCRLFRVEPVGRVVGGDKVPLKVSPNKRACQALRVVEELPAWQAFGPNGEAVVALLGRARSLSADELDRLAAREAARPATWNAARDAAWVAARAATWNAARAVAREAAWVAAWDAAAAAARDAARDATWDAARDAAWEAGVAAWAVLVRDLITPERFDILTKPWRDAGLPL